MLSRTEHNKNNPSICASLSASTLFSLFTMRAFAVALVAAAAAVTSAAPLEERDLVFDYIVVGSGAGGGPLASRLARANNTVLLIESGDDQGQNYNVGVDRSDLCPVSRG